MPWVSLLTSTRTLCTCNCTLVTNGEILSVPHGRANYACYIKYSATVLQYSCIGWLAGHVFLLFRNSTFLFYKEQRKIVLQDDATWPMEWARMLRSCPNWNEGSATLISRSRQDIEKCSTTECGISSLVYVWTFHIVINPLWCSFMLFILHFYVVSGCVEGAEQAVFDSYDLGDLKGLPLALCDFLIVT